MEEADIILDLLKRGEKKGLEMLFRRFYTPLVLYAYKFVREQGEAEDIVQEVFIKFWKQDKFIGVESYLRAYLYQSVRNHCLNELAEKKGIVCRGVERLNKADEEAGEEDIWLQQLEKIYEEIEKLPVKTRQIFKAVVLENKRYKQVADEQQISVNTVKTLLARGLSTLRNQFSGADFILFFWLISQPKR